MQIKNSFLYQFSKSIKPIISFYCIVLVFTILDYIAYSLEFSPIVSVSGWDFAGLIFLFVAGCVSTSDVFPMLLQNSVSRKTYFIAKILTVLSLSAMVAVFNIGISVLTEIVFKSIFNNSQVEIISMINMIYFDNFTYTLSSAMWTLLVTYCLSIFIFMLGMFLSSVFYRVGKFARVLISAGIPVTIFFVLPLVNLLFYEYDFIGRFMECVGSILNLPWKCAVFFSVMFIATTLASWFVTRRMSIKK